MSDEDDDYGPAWNDQVESARDTARLNAVPFGSGGLRLSVADVAEIERRRAVQQKRKPYRRAA